MAIDEQKIICINNTQSFKLIDHLKVHCKNICGIQSSTIEHNYVHLDIEQ